MDHVDYGKVSAKSQVVIPKTVRQQLGLKQGDVLRFRVSDGRVTIEKVREAQDDPFVTFSEWNSAEDDELYRDLWRPSPWDIVVVPFPYSERLAEKRRPALVVASDACRGRFSLGGDDNRGREEDAAR